MAFFAFPHKALQKLLYAEFITEKHASNGNLVTLAIYCEQANVMINKWNDAKKFEETQSKTG